MNPTPPASRNTRSQDPAAPSPSGTFDSRSYDLGEGRLLVRRRQCVGERHGDVEEPAECDRHRHIGEHLFTGAANLPYLKPLTSNRSVPFVSVLVAST